MAVGAAWGVEAIIKLKSVDDHILKLNGRHRSLLPSESAILTEYAQKILRYVVSRWPVDTGTSRDNWSITERPMGGDLGLRIYNTLTYVQYVHRAGTPKSAILWEPLIARAWNTHKTELINRLNAEITINQAKMTPEEFTGPQIEGSGWAAIQARFALSQPPGKALDTFARVFRADPTILRQIEQARGYDLPRQKVEVRRLAQKLARGQGIVRRA